MEACGKGIMEGLSPPPPAGATKAPAPQEQLKAIEEAQAQAMSPGDVWYCVSAIWHEHWTKFCQQAAAAGNQGGATEQELHPGRIDNSALAAAEGSPELGREVRGQASICLCVLEHMYASALAMRCRPPAVRTMRPTTPCPALLPPLNHTAPNTHKKNNRACSTATSCCSRRQPTRC